MAKPSQATSKVRRDSFKEHVRKLTEGNDQERERSVEALIRQAAPAVDLDQAHQLRWDPQRRAAATRALSALVRSFLTTPDTLPPLLEMLDSYDAPIKAQAAGILLKMGQKAIPVLLPLLRNREKALRTGARRALGVVSWIPTNTAEGAAYWIVSGKWDACKTMGSVAVEPLIAAATHADEDPNNKKDILRALGELGDHRAIPTLLAALKDQSLQEQAAESLGNLGARTATFELISILKSGENHFVRKAAAEALGRLGDTRAVASLVDALSDQTVRVRRAAEDALIQLGPPAANALTDAITNSQSPIRASAARVAGGLRDSAAVDALIALLKDSDDFVVECAAYALGQIRDPRAHKPLVTVARRRSESQRHPDDLLVAPFPLVHGELEQHSPQSIAAWALGELGDTAALEKLGRKPADATLPELRKDNIKEFDVPSLSQELRRYLTWQERDKVFDELATIGKPAVPELVRLLHNASFDIQSGAARALGVIRDPAAVVPLSEAFSFKNTSASSVLAAVKALAAFGDERSTEFLTETLKGWDVPVPDRTILRRALARTGNVSTLSYVDRDQREEEWKRDAQREAAFALASFKHPLAFHPLLAALESRETELRQRAAAALGNYGDVQAVRPLIRRLSDWDPNVRQAAAATLGNLSSSDAIKALRLALTDEHRLVRQTAARSLDALSWQPRTRRDQADYFIAMEDWARCSALGAPAVEPLTKRLQDTSESIRLSAVDALARCNGIPATQTLAKLLGDDRQELRKAAITAIAQSGRSELAGSLIESLRVEKHESVLKTLLQALQRLGIRPPVEAIVPLVERPQTKLRMAAIQLLGESRDSQAAPALIAALNAPSHEVQGEAIQSLAKLRSKEAVEPLTAFLQNGALPAELRVLAVDALGRLGDAATLPVLITTLRDSDARLRAGAFEALKELPNENTIGTFLWALQFGVPDVPAAEFREPLESVLTAFTGINFVGSSEDGDLPLRQVVEATARNFLRRHQNDAAVACYTNTLSLYANKIDLLDDTEDREVIARAVPFAFRLGSEGVKLFLESSDAASAGHVASWLLQLARVLGNLKIVWNELNNLCTVLAHGGNDRILRDVYRQTVDLIESTWFMQPHDELQLRHFFADKAELYDGLALCYLRMGAAAEAWETLEAAKARYLSDLIIRRKTPPAESYTQVTDEVWAPMRRASSDAQGYDETTARGARELAGIEPADGGTASEFVTQPQHREALAQHRVDGIAGGLGLTLVDRLWDAAPGWIGNPLEPSVREAFKPMRQCVHSLLDWMGDGPAIGREECSQLLDRSRDALSALLKFDGLSLPFDIIADFLPTLRKLSESVPPYSPARTLELEALGEVLNMICGEGKVFVTTRRRTENELPAKWRPVFRSAGSPESRQRRIHEASQRLSVSWERFAENRWRYVTRVARGQPSAFASLRALLDRDVGHAIVAFHVTNQGTIAHLFRSVANERDLLRLPARPDLEASDVMTFPSLTLTRIQELAERDWLVPLRRLQSEPDEQGEKTAMGSMDETLQRLYAELLSPIDLRLRQWGVRRVTLIPHRALHLLPLHACWYESGGSKRYLVDRYDVAYSPSTTLLTICHDRTERRAPSSPRLYALADPTGELAFAEEEVARIEQEFPRAARLLPSRAVDPNETRASATHLHFACHGSYDSRVPLDSALHVDADSRLTLGDLFADALPLRRASLVVLSACETGVIDSRDLADEYLGLAGGFLFAGAPAVVSTLWPVGDLATMLLMEKFYRYHLKDGLTAAASLRKAQRWLARTVTAEQISDDLTYKLKELRSKRVGSGVEDSVRKLQRRFFSMEPETRPFDNPYHWAAFTMNGVQ